MKMSMGYCRFQNALLVLRECIEVLEEFDSEKEFLESLSDDEAKAAKQLLDLLKFYYAT